MVPASSVVLHGGPVLEVTLLEYLFRVALYLFAFGGVAAVALWGRSVVGAFRSGVAERWSGGQNDS